MFEGSISYLWVLRMILNDQKKIKLCVIGTKPT